MLKNIAVLVSGGGTNLQACIDAEKSGIIKNGKIKLILSSKPDVYSLIRAKDNNIPAFVCNRKEAKDTKDFETQLINKLDEYKIDIIVLAGFLSILSEDFVKRYSNRIINVHPSLIPSFCGKGFYGLKVHEAALEYGVKISGATVHLVNEIPDGGEIILQKPVRVYKNDTPEKLQKRIMHQAEHIILPKAVEIVCKELIKQEVKQ
ncbi:phosphoribosylglycinamide formyltransferase [Eubacteriales bacterium OttesenSCG-928-G02]|nr:phosphoribosylglycinamide formyltransferase [Eubacteriales bacterium OttesenSCG-928-G02]